MSQPNNIVTVNNNGIALTTSLVIADKFNKEHKNVLQAIRSLECSVEFGRLNFKPSSYLNEQGKEQPMYNITRDGFAFLAMGFTGKEAAHWKEQFITAFNQMEAHLTAPAASPNTQPLELILTELISLMRDVAASQKQNIALIERLTEKPQPKTRAAHKDDLASIFQLNAEGVSQAEIGRTLGIGNPTVSLILRGAYRINPDGRITVGLLYKTESEGEPA